MPAGLAGLIPNVRVLNLNYNFLEDVRPLEGLARLRKLTLIGSRIKATKQLVRMLKGMVEVEVLDFRYVMLIIIIVIPPPLFFYPLGDVPRRCPSRHVRSPCAQRAGGHRSFHSGPTRA